MFMMKKHLLLLLFMSSCSISNAQWDNSAQLRYLEALREMEMLNRQIRPIVYDYHKAASEKYNRGDYRGSYEISNEFVQKYTIYKGQGGIASPIYAILGKSMYKLGKTDNAYYWLKLSKSQGNQEAYDYLEEIFHYFQSLARNKYYLNDYSQCISYADKALETTFYSGDIYILKGDAYKKMNMFSEAKRNYKLAKKSNPSIATLRIKELKEYIKEYKAKK